jgi:hypothetical protein
MQLRKIDITNHPGLQLSRYDDIDAEFRSGFCCSGLMLCFLFGVGLILAIALIIKFC